jgi:putative glutamine amidotransferase
MKFPGWILVFLVVWGSAFFADASPNECKPKDNRAVVIGHTYHLNWWMRTRLRSSARVMGYKLKLYDLRTAPSIEEGLKSVDGVVFPGGADINPDLYTRQDLPSDVLQTILDFKKYYKPSREGTVRDPFELGVYQTYYASEEFSELPVLGICRGMQMMAVSKGIPLLQDVRAELGIRNRYNRFDRFTVTDSQSVMSDLFPAGSALGFKYHHQNPRMDYLMKFGQEHPEVKITASSWSGRIVEAIELTDRLALGVQFHPEQSFPKVKHRVFRWLLNHACERTHKE